jgi:hypothetical protein
MKEGDHITIRSDSQSAIAAVTKRTYTSILVEECQVALANAREKYSVVIEWVKGHDDDTGNELADALAKEATEMTWQGPEPWVPLSMAGVKRQERRKMEEKWKEEWIARKDCRQSKTMMGEPSLELGDALRKETRGRLRSWVAFGTGHTHMRRHLAIIRQDDPDTTDIACRLCGEEDETPLHTLKCPALEYERIVCFTNIEVRGKTLALFGFIDDVERRIKATRRPDTPQRLQEDFTD